MVEMFLFSPSYHSLCLLYSILWIFIAFFNFCLAFYFATNFLYLWRTIPLYLLVYFLLSLAGNGLCYLGFIILRKKK